MPFKRKGTINSVFVTVHLLLPTRVKFSSIWKSNCYKTLQVISWTVILIYLIYYCIVSLMLCNCKHPGPSCNSLFLIQGTNTPPLTFPPSLFLCYRPTSSSPFFSSVPARKHKHKYDNVLEFHRHRFSSVIFYNSRNIVISTPFTFIKKRRLL